MFERYINANDFVLLAKSLSHYKININGIIKDKSGNIINPSLDSLGNLVVKIDWIDGVKEYKVANLVAFTFKPIHVPHWLWGRADVMFKDDNKLNVHPSNLIWKYRINYDTHNRFYYIPGYSRYVIDRDGLVTDTKQGIEIKRYTDNKGYPSLALKPDMGPWTKIGVHRVLALTFLDYSALVDHLHVNHIDGIKSNSILTNLEWCTPQQNVYHAITTGLNDYSKSNMNGIRKVLVKNIITNSIYEYKSYAACSRALGITIGEVKYRLRQKDQPVFHDNTQIKYLLDTTDWREVTKSEILNDYFNRMVIIKNVNTGEIKIFNSIVKCAEYLNISKDAVAYRIRYPNQPVWPDGFQYKYHSDPTPWREVIDIDKEILNSDPSVSVLMKNIITGEITEFSSQDKCAEYLNLSKGAMSTRLNTPGQLLYPGYLLFKYKSDYTPWREVTEPEKELELYGGFKPVLIKNSVTQKIKEYKRSVECAKDLGILVTTLNNRLKSKGQKIYPDGFQYKYKYDPTYFI